jgi:hypothetical protein
MKTGYFEDLHVYGMIILKRTLNKVRGYGLDQLAQDMVQCWALVSTVMNALFLLVL